MMIRFFVSLFFVSGVAISLSAQNFDELDALIAKDRLRATMLNFSVKPIGEWQAQFDGQTETWRWTEKGWACANSKRTDCKDFAPLTFQWLATPKVFFDQWVASKRVRIDLGDIRAERSVVTEDAEPETGEPVEPTLDFQGSRVAAEVWRFESLQNLQADFSISLRDYRIEKIEHNGVTEILKWRQAGGRPIELLSVTVERNGSRIVFVRARKPA